MKKNCYCPVRFAHLLRKARPYISKAKNWMFFLTLAFLIPASLSAGAEGAWVDWDDLTDAQQKQAYQELESENEALKEEIARLKAQPGDSGMEADPEGEDRETGGETESAGSFSVIGADQFLSDISASFQKRQEAARMKSEDELSAMELSEIWDFRIMVAEAERDFYEEYHGAVLTDLNLQYLCSEYCQGLAKQFRAGDLWKRTSDSTECDALYTAGYYNRAYALVELSTYYNLQLEEEIENLKRAVAEMDASLGEETRNLSVPSDLVLQVQTDLNDLGFLLGIPDGIAGRQTASLIERFQLMYGYLPADGIIDEELISQMEREIQKRGG